MSNEPIIVYPGGGWEKDLTRLLLDRLPADRQAQTGKEVCDTEALLYLYPRSLVAPMDSQWAQIFLYLGTRVLSNVPEDLKVENLSDYDMDMLRRLKRWIYQKRDQAIKDKIRQLRKEARSKNTAKKEDETKSYQI